MANSVSHGVGLLAAIVAVPFLLAAAARRDALAFASAGVFGTTIILLYAASALYHVLPAGRAKRALEVADNAAIFLLIAGTYTPFTLDVLRGPLGWALFGVIWALATAGVLATAIGGIRHPALSAGIYLGMGWLVLVAIGPLSRRMPAPGVPLIIAGGVAYTAGIVFYAARRLRYNHLIWHLFVLLGTACHFLAILRYAA